MDASQVILLLVLLALVAVALFVWQRNRSRARQHLQERFGPEYDRTVEEAGSRRRAEQELAERERRHAELQIRPLSTDRRAHFGTEWTAAQARFVDDPVTAVGDADRLVTELMRERGYPTEHYEEQAAVLSVEHADVIGHYREAHEIGSRADQATTEELRRSMVHYRELFEALLREGAGDEQAEPLAADRVTGTPRPASPPASPPPSPPAPPPAPPSPGPTLDPETETLPRATTGASPAERGADDRDEDRSLGERLRDATPGEHPPQHARREPPDR